MDYNLLHERILDLYEEVGGSVELNEQKAYDLYVELEANILANGYLDQGVNFSILHCVVMFLEYELHKLEMRDLNSYIQKVVESKETHKLEFMYPIRKAFGDNHTLSYILTRGVLSMGDQITKDESNHGYVYAFVMSSGATKIGKSTKPLNRVKQISSCNENYVKTVYCVECDNITTIESTMHNLFKQYKLRGEYFNVDITTIVNKLQEYGDVHIYDIKLDELGQLIVPEMTNYRKYKTTINKNNENKEVGE